ncbi:cyclic nucleotide-binding protein [Methylobacterium sp. Leaf399]|uniref:EAL domain-containing protein n=1 Tax=Methylobacterium sp. Leaf399 TaxID=1736364 RepID=UPI0006F2E0F3|nr:EAL domain-containing protein [Methylobacterium sp. Leaf399]KQT18880.1 cyclic nucleotide-binding protein [Methylobacterium sp. Leaf399]
MPDTYARLTLPTGSVLFEEGEVGRAAYLVMDGEIEIFLRREGGEVRLATRGAGEIVGEMALLDAGPRSASARVARDCSLIPVTDDQIQHRIAQLDPILRMCLGVVMARYRDMLAMVNRTTLPHPEPSRAAAPADQPVHSTQMQAAIGQLVMERELRRALDEGELVLFFQPIVRLDSGRFAGFEALMRWRHPERGLIPPLAFIPVAEASGLIVEITRWALAEVGRVMPEIMLAALQNPQAVEGVPFVSVNVSGHDLALISFPAMVAEMLATSGMAPESLKLEITESILMQDPRAAADALTRCRDTGMGIAIDDFGTGYSSLSYLSTLPITTLKVDRAFVQAMLGDPRSRKIVQTILRLADELAIPVVAEGIEIPAEAEALTAMGCAFGQGYLFGRPVPLAETLALVRTAGTRALAGPPTAPDGPAPSFLAPPSLARTG